MNLSKAWIQFLIGIYAPRRSIPLRSIPLDHFPLFLRELQQSERDIVLLCLHVRCQVLLTLLWLRPVQCFSNTLLFPDLRIMIEFVAQS